jgi:hypothetical protein
MPGIDSNTKLMLHFNRPDNTLPKAVTFVGGAALDTAQKKFGNSSLLLDGNGDYITVPDSDDFDFGTGDFTIEAWVNYFDYPFSGGGQTIVGQGDAGSNFWCFATEVYEPNSLWFTGQISDSATLYCKCPFFATEYVWYHVAFVRSSGVVYMFVNGVSQTVTVTNGSQSANLGDFSQVLQIGKHVYGYMHGWMDEFRVSKGIARWTSNFVPPTYALISDANTQLLLNFDGADGAVATYDSAGGDENGNVDKAITYVGTAQIDTAQKVFGGASLLLDGNSDYVSIPDSADWAFGSDNFTIDFWVNFSSFVGTPIVFSQYQNGTNFMYIQTNSTVTQFILYIGGAVVLSMNFTHGMSINQWYHMAIVRGWNNDANTWAITIDGSSIGTISNSTTYPDLSGSFLIGANYGDEQFVSGYLDEFRISNIARWTANFVVPASQYSSIPSNIKKINSVSLDYAKKINGVSYSSLKKINGILYY